MKSLRAARGAERDGSAEACEAWQQELSHTGLTQHSGGTADTPPSPVAVSHRRPPTPTRPASPAATVQQPQATGQGHPRQPVPLLTFPLTTPAAAMFPRACLVMT
ncbi:hypothetical protein NN561_008129 [Cricetulus griseus]